MFSQRIARFLPLLGLAFSAGLGTLASGQVVPNGWRQTFVDGFNSRTLSTTRWNVATYRDTFPGGLRDDQRYQSSRVKTGVSRAGAQVLELTSGRTGGVTGGGKIETKNRPFGNHGILRARIRLSSESKDKYIWPTFWSIDRRSGRLGELDIFEGKTLDSGVNYASHAGGSIRDFGFYPRMNTTTWRTYGVRIDRNSARPEFYINTTRHRRTPPNSWNRRSRGTIVFSSSPNLTQQLRTQDLPSMWVDWVTLHRP